MWPLIFGDMGVIGLLLSLLKQGQASEITRKAAEPGTQPGTQPVGSPLFSEGDQNIGAIDRNPYYRDTVETLAQYSPVGRVVGEQHAENERAATSQKAYADQIVGIMEGSKLKPLAEEAAARREKADAGYEARIGSYDATSADLRGRMQALNEESAARFRETAANPNVTSQAEMDAIVGRLVGSTNEGYATKAAQTEATAGARGVSPGAIAAQQEQLAGQNRMENLTTAAGVAATNASERARRQDWANQMLPTMGADLLGREADIGTRFGALGDALRGQQGNEWAALTGLSGDLSQAYENRLGGSLLDRASLDQPENLLWAAEYLDAVNRYNTQAQAGSAAEMANAFANFGGGMLNTMDSFLQRKAMGNYMNQGNNWQWLNPLLQYGMMTDATIAGML